MEHLPGPGESEDEAFHAGMVAVQAALGVRGAALQLRDMIAAAVGDVGGVQAFVDSLPFIHLVLSVGDGSLASAVFPRRSGRLAVIAADGARVRYEVGRLGRFHPQSGEQCAALFVDMRRRVRYRVNGVVERADDSGFDVRVCEAFPNCPKYITARVPLEPAPSGAPVCGEVAAAMTPEQVALVAAADTMFVGSCFRLADASHRGGLPGFVGASARALQWDEYQGNNLNMTLGNLHCDPRVAVSFVDFDRRSLLNLSGTAKLTFLRGDGDDGEGVRVDVAVERVEQIDDHMPRFRFLSWSPFNPPLRVDDPLAGVAATLTDVLDAADSVKSLLFRLSRPLRAEAGQNGLFQLPGKLGRRSWTLTRVADDGLAVGISVKLNAALTRGASAFLHAAAPGTEIRLVSVQGEFGPFFGERESRPKRAVFVTAGIGVTPAVAAVRHAGRRGLERLAVVHFDSAPSAVPHLRELQQGADDVFLFTHPNRPRLTAALLVDTVPYIRHCVAYVCGPPAFMADAKAALAELCVPVQTEDFSY